MSEPEILVLQLLRNIREDMREGLDRMDNKIDNLGAELRSEMHSLRADVASDLMTMEKRLNDQFVGLRRSVMEYHPSAMACFSASSRSACAAWSNASTSSLRNRIKVR